MTTEPSGNWVLRAEREAEPLCARLLERAHVANQTEATTDG